MARGVVSGDVGDQVVGCECGVAGECGVGGGDEDVCGDGEEGRKSVGEGKRVDLGGRRIIKKKNNNGRGGGGGEGGGVVVGLGGGGGGRGWGGVGALWS